MSNTKRSIAVFLVALAAMIAILLLWPSDEADAFTPLPLGPNHGVYTTCDIQTTDYATNCDSALTQAGNMGIRYIILGGGALDTQAKVQAANAIAVREGVKIVWSASYSSNRGAMRDLVSWTKGLSSTYGYYIADEPGQFGGDIPTIQNSVATWATEIKTTLGTTAGKNYVFTVHYACTPTDVDRWQLPYLKMRNVDYAMVDCYMYNYSTWTVRGKMLNYAWGRASVNQATYNKPRSVVAQAFDWGSPNTISVAPQNMAYGWPNIYEMIGTRDCAWNAVGNQTIPAPSMVVWFSQYQWRKYNLGWAGNTWLPAMKYMDNTVCPGTYK